MSILSNETAVITGGARGIGFAIAKELVDQGVKVVICSRTKADLEKALKLLNKKKETAFGRICDVSSLRDCKELIAFAQKKLHKVDILVNNAGIYGPIDSFEKININDFRKTIEINLLGMVYCSYFVIPIMKKNGNGKIINLCGAGVGGNTLPKFAAYFTSKFAVAGFTEVLADELKEKNITVNAISPGPVNTYLNRYLIEQGAQKSGKEMYENAIQQQKDGGTSPELTAKLVVYLASPQASHITGKLLSAKWNPPQKLIHIKEFGRNLYTLRKINQEQYYEKKE